MLGEAPTWEQMDVICQPYKETLKGSHTCSLIDLAEFIHIAESWRQEHRIKQQKEPMEAALLKAVKELDENGDKNIQVHEIKS